MTGYRVTATDAWNSNREFKHLGHRQLHCGNGFNNQDVKFSSRVRSMVWFLGGGGQGGVSCKATTLAHLIGLRVQHLLQSIYSNGNCCLPKWNMIPGIYAEPTLGTLETPKETLHATDSCLSVSWHLHSKACKSLLWRRSLRATVSTDAEPMVPICLCMPFSPEVLSRQLVQDFFNYAGHLYTFPILFWSLHDWRLFSVQIGWYFWSHWHQSCRGHISDYRRNYEGWT